MQPKTLMYRHFHPRIHKHIQVHTKNMYIVFFPPTFSSIGPLGHSQGRDRLCKLNNQMRRICPAMVDTTDVFPVLVGGCRTRRA